jgi:transposase
MNFFWFDTVLLSFGNAVLRLPSYTCMYPVKYSWAKMKITARENVTGDLSLQRLVHLACLTEDD